MGKNEMSSVIMVIKHSDIRFARFVNGKRIGGIFQQLPTHFKYAVKTKSKQTPTDKPSPTFCSYNTLGLFLLLLLLEMENGFDWPRLCLVISLFSPY
ncbi:hypothetical protein CEXT_342821 [Caerostris extrusa]|uniref:Uncharacterized protein n=1 Tax=Caerostris extrusa TaxID=172846 RepID=A0AAV4RGV0_CAEEX|nr:hypothetical protein CEXT_342821 [Caerostris extrusa]